MIYCTQKYPTFSKDRSALVIFLSQKQNKKISIFFKRKKEKISIPLHFVINRIGNFFFIKLLEKLCNKCLIIIRCRQNNSFVSCEMWSYHY